MTTIDAQARSNWGDRWKHLGLPTETLAARLGELSSGRLEALGRSGLLATPAAAANRFSAGWRDGHQRLPVPFSNPPPASARAVRAPWVGATYAGAPAERLSGSNDDALAGLLHARRRGPVTMGLALRSRSELRERTGVALGAMIVADGRADGIISVRRPAASSGTSTGAPLPGSGSSAQLPPPAPVSGTGTIWEIMMAMDRAILTHAARLGLGQSSGASGSLGMMEAMGLWSLTPDDDDPSAWMGFGRGSTGGSRARFTAGDRASGPSPTGTPGPEDQSTSLDVEVMRLKRMIDKKTQMMELYSQTLSKYNSSANTIITNMKG